MTTPSTPSTAAPTEPEARVHLLVGALQAALAYALYLATRQGAWPATEAAAFVPLFLLMALAPLGFYLASAAPLRRRVAIALGVGAVALAIGAYHGLTVSGLAANGPTPGPFREDDYLMPTFVLGLALMIAVPAAAVAREGRVRYEPWFDALLHNTLLLAQGALVTGLFWLVMFSAAALFKLVRLPFLSELIERGEFWIPATALVFSYGVSLAVTQRTVARFLFDRVTQLCGWIYPLAGALGVAFVASWLFQGIEPLLQTRRAAFLLWFAVLSVLLVNASSRGGLDEPRYPRWLRRALSTGLLVLLPMVAVALYALGLRIEQYGWTVDRFWGLFVAIVIAVFALGYALNALAEWAGRAERCLVPATNAMAAGVVVLGILLLLSGALDPRRVSVNDQVRRLMSDSGDEQDLIRYLAREGGVFGRRALQALASDDPVFGGVPAARQALARDALSDADTRRERQSAVLRALPVFPAGAVAPSALLDALAREGGVGACERDTCLIWRLPPEVLGADAYALLSRESTGPRGGGGARVWRADARGQWAPRGNLPGQGLDARCQSQPGAAALFDAVREGRVESVPPPQRDLSAGGLRFSVQRWGRADGCD
jgi:hypothetical protein